ncbi:hypothetical protein LTR78_006249 [Recurvomyces mirabilis]|uniref:Cercosporin MFS transporter CTB4 n=1 Tax=Recurvomyces mirabilis TaxID=574656 RepID=A0AAE0WL24_9PEZI|nr:hypothetical protein LTR78_006249 [Recurvomyces mirabilis]KAK5152138.1 hypothetical protein LTS14_008513 [Recurvomyces mirabilis]
MADHHKSQDNMSNRASYRTINRMRRINGDTQMSTSLSPEAVTTNEELARRTTASRRRSSYRRSVQPTAYDRLSTISATTGLSGSAYLFDYEANPEVTSNEDASYHTAMAARALTSNERPTNDGYELEMSRTRGDQQEQWAKADAYEAEEAGVQGLVRRTPSARHKQMMGRSASSIRSRLSRVPSHPKARIPLRRQNTTDGRVICALPSLPDALKSGTVSPEPDASSPDLEKGAPLSPQPPFVFPAPPGPPGAGADPNLVLWDGPNDPGNPMNWSRGKKWMTTFVLGFVTFTVTFASSVFSPGTHQAAQDFNVSDEVMILSTSLFVLGFAFGPIIWGPASELYGRKWPMFIGVAIFGIFQIPVAVAQNVYTIFICRFMAGFFGCAPLTIIGGTFADFWAPVDRGVAVSIFSIATFLGPTGGPIVGGYLTETTGFGWRWTAWVTLIAVFSFGTIGWAVVDESFGPVLLQRRARALRFATKNWAIHAPADEIEINMNAIANKYLTKPVMMLVYEPILLLITLYTSFIYDLFFVSFPISYVQERHWSLGLSGLPFLGVMVGVCMGGLVNFAFVKTRYVRILKQKGSVPPEERLVPMMVGAVALPIGLFVFGWTSSPDLTPIPQIISGAPVGLGIVLIFLQGINYIVDVYMMFANSAIAGNTIIRSLFGAAFPLFASYMYQGLGVAWATSVLGFVAVALIPVPMLFFVYGARIRKLSRFTPKFGPGMGPPGGGPPGMGRPPGVGGPPGMGPPPGLGMPMGAGPPGR